MLSSTEEGDIKHPPLINVKSDNETFINDVPNMDDPSVILIRLRTKNLNKHITGQININFREKSSNR